MRSALAQWRTLPDFSPVVERWIDPGVRLLWDASMGRPPRHVLGVRNSRTVEIYPAHLDFVDNSCFELLDSGVVYETTAKAIWVLHPLAVAPKKPDPVTGEERFRLILDARYLNEYVQRFVFKMETLGSRRHKLRPGDWMTSIDLKSGYWHLGIHPEHHKYFGFSHQLPSREKKAFWTSGALSAAKIAEQRRKLPRRYFIFSALCFGLRTAPFIFTKLMRQVGKLWRKRGWRFICYIDDWLLIADSEAQCAAMTRIAQEDFRRLHIVINAPKSHLTPAQLREFLGFNVHTSGADVRVAVTDYRKQSCLQKTLTALRVRAGDRISARDLASLAGTYMSMSLALGPTVRVRSRDLYLAIERRTSWRGAGLLVDFLPDERAELEFLAHLVMTATPIALWPATPLASMVVVSDASDDAYGGYAARAHQQCLAYSVLLEAGTTGYVAACATLADHDISVVWEFLSPGQRDGSSTLRELIGALGNLKSRRAELKDLSVLLLLDSQAAVAILHHGSSIKALNDIAKEILDVCAAAGISLQVRWHRRDAAAAAAADVISKWAGERVLARDTFALVGDTALDLFDAELGVDLFASPRSVQGRLPYFTRAGTPSRDVQWCDAFTAPTWARWLCYAFPPSSLVAQTLERFRSDAAAGVLLASWSESAPWWPELCRSAFYIEFLHPDDSVCAWRGYPEGTAPPPSRGLVVAWLDFRSV